MELNRLMAEEEEDEKDLNYSASESESNEELDSDYSDTEGSSSDSSCMIAEESARGKLSNLSIGGNTRKSGDKKDNEDSVDEIAVRSLIQAGKFEKLKVEQCKVYLRSNGLRLTGNKDTLIQRIKEHQQILNGGGRKMYPTSSFVLNCKGDACTGDVVMFEQNVYETYSIVSRSASGPRCGKRIVAGRILKESYGSAKQQHTFTIEVLWSEGEKPFPPLYQLLIKGRNLYRFNTLRQKWEDEGKRCRIVMEKHSRGNLARSDRESRLQEKERKKLLRKSKALMLEKSHMNHREVNDRLGVDLRHHRQPLTTMKNPTNPVHINGRPQKQKLCRYFAQGRCHYENNCKFLHESENVTKRLKETSSCVVILD